MAACNFSIPFSGSAEQILEKARTAVQGQGGNFIGDLSGGSFDLSIFGNTIAGSYTVSGNTLNVIIDNKPFLVPCSTIENFLTKQLH